jgi:hypothetical protein
MTARGRKLVLFGRNKAAVESANDLQENILIR